MLSVIEDCYMKVVLIRFKGSERRELALHAGTTVMGRRADVGLRIPAGDVSRQHCQISVTDDTVAVKDLDSANGTFVNGKRVTEAELSAGDRLGIGPVVFAVQIDGQPELMGPSDMEIDAAPPIGEQADIFELGEGDFDIEDAITAFDELDDDKDLP